MKLTKDELDFLHRLYCEIRDEPTAESIEKKYAFLDSLPEGVKSQLLEEIVGSLPDRLNRFQRLVESAEPLD